MITILFIVAIIIVFLILLSFGIVVSNNSKISPGTSSDPNSTFENINVLDTTRTTNLKSSSSSLGNATASSVDTNSLLSETANVSTLTSENASLTNANIGNLTIGDLSITSITTENATVTQLLTANEIISQKITNAGNISTATLSSSGNASIGGNISVGGNETVTGSLGVGEGITAGGDLTVGGNSSLSGTLSVGGNVSTSGGVTISKTLTVGEAATFNSSITGTSATFSGDVSANNVSVTNNIHTSTLTATGLSTTNGITNTGLISTDILQPNTELRLPSNSSFVTDPSYPQIFYDNPYFKVAPPGGSAQTILTSGTAPNWIQTTETYSQKVYTLAGITTKSLPNSNTLCVQCSSVSSNFVIFTDFGNGSASPANCNGFWIYNTLSNSSTFFNDSLGYYTVACYNDIIAWVISLDSSSSSVLRIGRYDPNGGIYPITTSSIQSMTGLAYFTNGGSVFPNYSLTMNQRYVGFVNTSNSGGQVEYSCRVYSYNPETLFLTQQDRSIVSPPGGFTNELSGSPVSLLLSPATPEFAVMSYVSSPSTQTITVDIFILGGNSDPFNDNETRLYSSFSFVDNSQFGPASIDMVFNQYSNYLHVFIVPVNLPAINRTTAVTIQYDPVAANWIKITPSQAVQLPLTASAGNYQVYCGQTFYNSSGANPDFNCQAPNGILGQRTYTLDGIVYLTSIVKDNASTPAFWTTGMYGFEYSPGGDSFSIYDTSLSGMYSLSSPSPLVIQNLYLSKGFGGESNTYDFTKVSEPSCVYWILDNPTTGVMNGLNPQFQNQTLSTFSTTSMAVSDYLFLSDSAGFKLPVNSSAVNTTNQFFDGNTVVDNVNMRICVRVNGKWFFAPLFPV